jgi:hypothetical protein
MSDLSVELFEKCGPIYLFKLVMFILNSVDDDDENFPIFRKFV